MLRSPNFFHTAPSRKFLRWKHKIFGSLSWFDINSWYHRRGYDCTLYQHYARIWVDILFDFKEGDKVDERKSSIPSASSEFDDKISTKERYERLLQLLERVREMAPVKLKILNFQNFFSFSLSFRAEKIQFSSHAMETCSIIISSKASLWSNPIMFLIFFFLRSLFQFDLWGFPPSSPLSKNTHISVSVS